MIRYMMKQWRLSQHLENLLFLQFNVNFVLVITVQQEWLKPWSKQVLLAHLSMVSEKFTRLRHHQQLIVSDGKKIYFQMNDLEQVIVRDLQVAIDSVPSLILVSDLSKLGELFAVSQSREAGNVDLFELKPLSPQSTYTSILLSFVDGDLIGLRIIDGLGQSTEVIIQSAIDYSELGESEFDFVMPKNFDIVEG